MSGDVLYIANIVRSCRTLGPGSRVVLWVARCSRGCPGCIAEPIIGPDAGQPVGVDELAATILGWPEANALTLSGGEPFEQAEALLALCMKLRSHRDFSLMAFSGFSRAALERGEETAQAQLLSMLDILVDGPYIRSRGGDFLWRGSDNQTIHLLTDRHSDMSAQLDGPGVGIEFRVTQDGRLFWAGIPTPGLAGDLDSGLAALGISLRAAPSGGLSERLPQI